jgi:histidyl-tRNA synthetase
MAYANAKAIPFVAMIGENEIATNTITLKNMTTGEQVKVKADELVSKFSK